MCRQEHDRHKEALDEIRLPGNKERLQRVKPKDVELRYLNFLLMAQKYEECARLTTEFLGQDKVPVCSHALMLSSLFSDAFSILFSKQHSHHPYPYLK